jgi:hypothetical protein
MNIADDAADDAAGDAAGDAAAEEAENEDELDTSIPFLVCEHSAAGWASDGSSDCSG